MKTTAWLITAKTNIHVGDDSSTSFGIIDKSVQRDAITTIPCINSSSLKGAINEYCTKKTELEPATRKKIFGIDKAAGGDYQKGESLFFDANLLFLPIQDNTTLYKLAYCNEVLAAYVAKAKLLGIEVTADELKAGLNNLKEIKDIAEFKELCNDEELPIIARNVLDNGESKNLWYEQYVPSEAIFGTFIVDVEGDALSGALNSKIVQIGANATIGFGYTEFKKIK